MRRSRRLITAACAAAVVAAVSAGAAVAPPSAGAAGPRARAAGAACGGDSVGIFSTSSGRVVAIRSIPVCGAGSVSVTFSADPATCAASGVCGYAGTESVSLAGAGDLALTTVKYRGTTRTSATLALVPGPASSAVTRTVPGGVAPGSCSDTNGSGNVGGFFSSLPSHAGRDTVALTVPGAQLLGTRCAGPTTADLRGALPAVALTPAQLAHGRRVIDLSGTRPFTSHGFTGTVRSTVTLTLGTPRRQSPHSGQPTGAHRVRVRILTVADRIAALRGRALATVTTSAQTPACAPLDACGLSGTIDVTPRSGAGGALDLTATAPLRRPAAQLRAALGLQGAQPPRPRITVVGGGASERPGTVAADLTQGPTACRDAVDVRAVDLQAQVDRAGALKVSLVPYSGDGDPLRTRCPGPDLGEHALARAIVPRAQWRRRTFAVALHGTHFSDGPYRVAIASSLRLVLRRERVSSKVAVTFAGG